MSHQILVVEDDRFLQENLLGLLRAEGCEAKGISFGQEAVRELEEREYDLVILDLGLPDIDGITTCRRIRAQSHVPILMLTARTDAMDKVMGLETGADDYLTKPFNASELIARVRAQLRRKNEYGGANPPKTAGKTFVLGDLQVDYERREVTIGGKLIELTTKEFDVIAYLSLNCDRAISRDQLFQEVWGFDLDFSTNSLDVHIYRLRKKLEANHVGPKFLHTLRGYGYKLALTP